MADGVDRGAMVRTSVAVRMPWAGSLLGPALPGRSFEPSTGRDPQDIYQEALGDVVAQLQVMNGT